MVELLKNLNEETGLSSLDLIKKKLLGPRIHNLTMCSHTIEPNGYILKSYENLADEDIAICHGVRFQVRDKINYNEYSVTQL